MSEFGWHGYHGTSTSVVTARADVPQPHLYANFSTKRELFLSCLDEYLPRVLAGTSVLEHDLLAFQAVAVSADPALAPFLQSRLAAFHDRETKDRYAPALLRAAETLMTKRPATSSTTR